jgi:hypothetical protein
MVRSASVQRLGFELWTSSLALLAAATSACSSAASLGGDLPAPTSRGAEHEDTFDVPLVSLPAAAAAVCAKWTTTVDDTASGRDASFGTKPPRSVAVLATELHGLESILRAMQPTSRARPTVLRRLVEDCLELERATSGRAAAATHLAGVLEALRQVVDAPAFDSAVVLPSATTRSGEIA